MIASNPVCQGPYPLLALHGATLPGTSLLEDVVCAETAGFDAIEVWWPKVVDYLRMGGTGDELISRLGGLHVTMLNVLMPVETRDRRRRAALLKQCEQMAVFAAGVGCPTIQAVALDDFTAADWADQRVELVDSLGDVLSLASAHGVRLALEPVSFSPFRTLEQALDVIDSLGRERVGLVLDTWHLWTAGILPTAVGELDPGIVDSVQVSDATPRSGPVWSDADRAVLPGDGLIPLDDMIAAIAQTGYCGPWSCEALGLTSSRWHPLELAMQLRRRLADHLADVGLRAASPGDDRPRRACQR